MPTAKVCAGACARAWERKSHQDVIDMKIVRLQINSVDTYECCKHVVISIVIHLQLKDL